MSGLPRVSIVLPVRNEAASIRRTLEAALGQDYAGPLEVVVADGMSDDGTRRIVEELAAADSRLRLVSNSSGGTAAGLNAAIEASTGDIVVRCDGHAVLPPRYVTTAVELLDETGAMNVGGIQRAVGVTPFQRAVAMAMTSPIGVGDARFHLGGRPGDADTVYLGVFRREVFDRVGLFDESLVRNQDYELNWRIRRSGGSVYFHPDLVVDYAPRSGVAALWRQYFEYGYWKREMLRRHPESVRWRQLVAPAFVLALAASAALALTPAAPLAIVVPAAYAATVIGFTLHAAVTRRDPAAFLMPAAVATMHLAWGLGFLVGSLRGSRAQRDASDS